MYMCFFFWQINKLKLKLKPITKLYKPVKLKLVMSSFSPPGIRMFYALRREKKQMSFFL